MVLCGTMSGDCVRWWEAIQIEPINIAGRAGLQLESAELWLLDVQFPAKQAN